MNHRMTKRLEIWLILAMVVVVALLAALWAITHMPFRAFEPRVPFSDSVLGDIELFYTVKTVVSTVNITLLVFLLLTYVDIYNETRSDFTIGLIIFSMVLLLYAFSSNPMVQSIFGFHAFGLGPFAMLPDLFTCAALVVLLYITIKY